MNINQIDNIKPEFDTIIGRNVTGVSGTTTILGTTSTTYNQLSITYNSTSQIYGGTLPIPGTLFIDYRPLMLEIE